MSSGDGWSKVLDRTKRAVVQIININVRHFDANPRAATVGTGFIVDRKLGLILSNRHVVTTGPCHSRALFYGDFEVPLKPFYVDPVHDFGFFKYDPERAKETKCEELSLNPAGPAVGVEVRILGSDAGERTMVLRGTIAQLYRNCPEYDPGSGFSDQNTFYIAASCDTSGGSSGSPVIDKFGKVIALNAGAALDATSSFFLPLDRIVHALNRIREWLRLPAKSRKYLREFIPRGTLECVFEFTSMPLCKRLGVTDDEERWLRSAATFNKCRELLVVRDVMVEGTAAKAGLKNGDVLLKVNGKCLTHFVDLETCMDESRQSDKPIQLELKRAKEVIQVEIRASDAYRFIPDEYLEFGGGVFHAVGFANARDFSLPLDTVIIDNPAYVLNSLADVPDNIALIEVDGRRICNVRDLADVIKRATTPSVMMRYHHNYVHFTEDSSPLPLADARWHDIVLATRSPEDFSEWSFEHIKLNPEISQDEQTPKGKQSSDDGNGSIYRPPALSRAIVMIRFSTPLPLEGIEHQDYLGCGYIWDLSRGLVVTDRNTVVSTVGNVYVSFFATAQQLPATVVYLHPMHNLALIRFDPAKLSNQDGLICELDTSTGADGEGAIEGEVLEFIGFDRDFHLLHTHGHVVKSVDHTNVSTPYPPRFSPKGFESIIVAPPLIKSNVGGLLVNSKGRVRALASTVSIIKIEDDPSEIGIITRVGPVFRMIERYIAEYVDHNTPSLACQWGVLTLAHVVKDYGLPADWAKECEEALDSFGLIRCLLVVSRVLAGSRPAKVLRPGDIILQFGGVTTCSFSDLEHMCEMAPNGVLTLTILRDRKVVKDLHVEVERLSGAGLDRVVRWQGFWVHSTPDPVRWAGLCPEDCNAFVSYSEFGSPAERGGAANAFWWILEVNGRKIKTSDDLLQFGKTERALRIRILTIHGREHVLCIEPDMTYWPPKELRRDPATLSWNHYDL